LVQHGFGEVRDPIASLAVNDRGRIDPASAVSNSERHGVGITDAHLSPKRHGRPQRQD
jgi:hypothetical protein